MLLASCVNPNEKLYRNLKEGPVDIEEAKIAIADGADVTQLWNSSCFLEMAAWRRDGGAMARLFVEHGANPWEEKSGAGTFSLFDYAVKNHNSVLLCICLDYKAIAPELAEAKTAAFVESVIDAVKNDRLSYFGFELNFCEEIWSSGLALSTKPKLEAAQKYAAEEKARLEKERQRLEKERARQGRKTVMREERDDLRARLQGEIFPAEEKLSEEERSRGWTLLTEFGEAHMPRLAERCSTARRNFLEAKANLSELVAALKAENSGLETNDVFQAAKNRWLDLAAEYWWLRYKLTDNYSAFKVGALTADELDAKDKELAELLK